MFAASFPEPELAANGTRIALKLHVPGLTSIAVAGFPGGVVALMGDTGKIFHLFRALSHGYGAANPVADGPLVSGEKRFVNGAGVLGTVDDGRSHRIGRDRRYP